MSDTSSEVKPKYQNADGLNLLNDKKQQSTDTDFYFNMLANPIKLVDKVKSDSESSNSNYNKSTSSIRSSSSTFIIDKINISPKNNNIFSETKNNNNFSETKKTTFENAPAKNNNFENAPLRNNNFENAPAKNNNFENAPVKNNIETPVILTEQEIKLRKIEMLRKLCEIKTKGFTLSKEYNFSSSLEEMEYEYALLKSFADKRNGVKIFRSGFLQVVSVIEFLNDKYDPFDFHLSGWNEHLQIEIDSWEDVLEEIYEKYKGSGKKMAPEIKLLYLIIASASAFHFTKAHASKLPGLDTMLASNPGLISKIINPGKQEKSQFMTAQEINIEKQKAEFKKRDLERKQPSVQTHVQQPASNIPEIRAPSQVKDILNRIHNLKPSHETQEETSNNDRIVSESTISELNSTAQKKKAALKKKSNISIK